VEIHRSSLHGLDRERNVAMAGNHDHRQANAQALHPAQQLEPVDFWHPHVGDDASAFNVGGVLQKAHGRVVTPDRKLGGAQQECERFPHRLVVIDDMYNALRGHRSTPLSAPKAT
jgi:hypothetical protein